MTIVAAGTELVAAAELSSPPMKNHRLHHLQLCVRTAQLHNNVRSEQNKTRNDREEEIIFVLVSQVFVVRGRVGRDLSRVGRGLRGLEGVAAGGEVEGGSVQTVGTQRLSLRSR